VGRKHCHPADHAEVVLVDLLREVVQCDGLQSEFADEADDPHGCLVPGNSFPLHLVPDLVQGTVGNAACPGYLCSTAAMASASVR
jgi:hypothetical protein